MSGIIVVNCCGVFAQIHTLYDCIIIKRLQKGMEIREKSCKLQHPETTGLFLVMILPEDFLSGAMKKTVKNKVQ
ncbi:MAG: hypothetical protein HGA26_02770 [Chlorobiaceae bacterium]|nr:hypothetical protein [Chlorobiaceae bacterium]